MKYVLLLPYLFLLIGCEQEKIERLEKKVADLQAENNTLKDEKTELVRGLDARDKRIRKYFEDLLSIYQSLNRIGSDQLTLLNYSRDMENASKIQLSNLKERIDQRLNSIAGEFSANEDRFTALRENTSGQLEAYRQLVNKLYQSNLEQKQLIVDLETQLRDKLLTIEGLRDTISDKERELATRYYLVGSESYLKDVGILESRGGFIFGSVLTLVQPINERRFNVTSIHTSEIYIGATIDELVPERPKSSFQIVGEGAATTIRIVDAKAFWQSLHLAIVTE